MSDLIATLETAFEQSENPTTAVEQKAYMRNQFEFYGIKSPVRRAIQQPFLIKAYLPDKKELESLVKILFLKPHREYQYFAQELVLKYAKQYEKKDIALFEYMVTHKSWWDTVDFIAAKIMGAYFKKFPEQQKAYVHKWLNSNNIWLQRSALLFQLKYKADVNTEILRTGIHFLLGSKEFFINKAIGWMLREYSKTNPIWVKDFVSRTELSALSKKEALRLLK